MEDSLIIKILSDHLHGVKTVLPENVDIGALAGLARIHQVDGIIYKQCGFTGIPSMAEAYSAAIFYYANRTKTVEKISEAFRKADIPFFTVKGLNISKYYPIPALRTMGDCDIAVEPERFEEAVKLMQSLGFSGHMGEGRHEFDCDGFGLHFELHNQLLKSHECISEKQINFCNDFMPYYKDNSIDISFHFLYLILHLRKHMASWGAGLRQFFDLAAVIKNCDGLDWRFIEEKLEYLDTAKFAHVCFSLIEYWFSVSVPIPFERCSEAFIKDIEGRVLKGGVFGNYDEEKPNTHHLDFLNNNKYPVWFNRIVAIFNSVFLSYSDIKSYPGISYINGRPWLLPIAWVHRFIILLKRKDKSKSLETLQLTLVSKEILDERKKYLEDMGMQY